MELEFHEQITDEWTNLPTETVLSETVNSFKGCVDLTGVPIISDNFFPMGIPEESCGVQDTS